MRLSEIGDPRPGVGLREDGLPDILWCEIPKGQVEIEGHGRRKVTPFRIAAYPVTCAQYKAFLDAEDGYPSERWWDDLKHEPEPGRQLRPYASYPADNVSWWDATAFCRWLSLRLGFEVRLPDEWEWQWAAQSARRDFSYPWGEDWQDGVANTREARIGRTTAVGMYPGGRNAQGAYDLSGNVWEWCLNEYSNPERVGPEGSGSRVLRGGSWVGGRDRARAGYRLDTPPDDRCGDDGFRVVCASPIR
jgi:formylglycine-generating enzyme required for sulfatase activity